MTGEITNLIDDIIIVRHFVLKNRIVIIINDKLVYVSSMSLLT